MARSAAAAAPEGRPSASQAGNAAAAGSAVAARVRVVAGLATEAAERAAAGSAAAGLARVAAARARVGAERAMAGSAVVGWATVVAARARVSVGCCSLRLVRQRRGDITRPPSRGSYCGLVCHRRLRARSLRSNSTSQVRRRYRRPYICRCWIWQSPPAFVKRSCRCHLVLSLMGPHPGL